MKNKKIQLLEQKFSFDTATSTIRGLFCTDFAELNAFHEMKRSNPVISELPLQLLAPLIEESYS